MPSRNPNRRAPARRDPNEIHPDKIEPKQGMEFVLERYRKDGRDVVERKKISRVIRQGNPDHGQDLVWTIEYQIEAIDSADQKVVLKIMWWIMYDRHRQEWADARLVQDEAAKRGTPIYATPGKIPPLGRLAD